MAAQPAVPIAPPWTRGSVANATTRHAVDQAAAGQRRRVVGLDRRDLAACPASNRAARRAAGRAAHGRRRRVAAARAACGTASCRALIQCGHVSSLPVSRTTDASDGLRPEGGVRRGEHSARCGRRSRTSCSAPPWLRAAACWRPRLGGDVDRRRSSSGSSRLMVGGATPSRSARIGGDRLDRAGAAEQVPGHRLGGGDDHAVAALAERRRRWPCASADVADRAWRWRAR